MKSDQFGFSDLDVAYSIRERLSSQCDFRIWEYEPTINGVITLLRKVDVAICMRFHAAIFALSQDVKTIGLDYSLSGKGKVDALFENRVDNCLSIINFKADELLTLLKN
jgi:polysaccharide pyruvyl transferase WcaK-like protein